MRVRVDEPGEERDGAQVDVGGVRVGWFVRAACPDAAFVDRDPPVANRRPDDRNEPGGAIPDQARDDLPARLRAG